MTAASTSCRARCAGGSTRSCCRCRRRPRRRWRSSPARVGELGAALALPEVPAAADEIRRVVTIFRELRDGVTADGRTSLKQPTGTLSTAEAISVVTNGLALAAHFGDGTLRAERHRRRHRRRRGARSRCTTTSRGASTSRGWSVSATVGATSTTPAASSPDDAPGPSPAHPIPELHLLGIRHHGPGSARSVLRALDELRPDVGAGRGAGRRRRRPGVDRRRRARAARRPARLRRRRARAGRVLAAGRVQPGVAGRARGRSTTASRSRPIDLPLACSLAARDGEASLADGAATTSRPTRSATLAAAAGEPDAERWWEDVVEHRGDGEPVFDAVGEAMAAVRGGTLRRRRTTRARSAHAPAHPCALAEGRRDGRRRLRGLARPGARPDGDHGQRPTRHVLARAAEGQGRRSRGCRGRTAASRRATGYGAGVRSPGWYAHVFRHPGPDGVSRFFVDAAHALRRRGLPASPDHLIAASRLADTLAALRHRPRAGLAEVLDAADVGARRAAARRRRARRRRRDRRGPADAPQVPLARDLAARAAGGPARSRGRRRAASSSTCARRTACVAPTCCTACARSACRGASSRRAAGPAARSARRGGWRGSPSCRSVSSSAAGHGTTVEAAATSRLVEQVTHATRLADAAASVDLALLADLPDAVRPPCRALGALAGARSRRRRADGRARPAGRAMRYGDVRGTDAGALRRVFDELVVRVVAGLGAACRRSTTTPPRRWSNG